MKIYSKEDTYKVPSFLTYVINICLITSMVTFFLFTVIFYEDENGDKPVEEFLLSLDKKCVQKYWGFGEYWKKRGIFYVNLTANR